MKIILNSYEDVQDFLSLVGERPRIEGKPPEMGAAYAAHQGETAGQDTGEDWAPATPERIRADCVKLLGEMDSNRPRGDAMPEDVQPIPEELDATGRPWDEEIDSAAKTKTAKGVWTRSRRRDLTDERYNARVAELIAEQRAQDAGEGEPVATETHALPADVEALKEALDANEEGRDPVKDLTALVEASREAAGELAGDMKPLLDASKAFIGEYGTAAFNELKQAVVPTDDGNGKPLPTMSPGERRLLEACISNYATFA